MGRGVRDLSKKTDMRLDASEAWIEASMLGKVFAYDMKHLVGPNYSGLLRILDSTQIIPHENRYIRVGSPDELNQALWDRRLTVWLTPAGRLVLKGDPRAPEA